MGTTPNLFQLLFQIGETPWEFKVKRGLRLELGGLRGAKNQVLGPRS
jgi:hypothetical protein